MNSISRNGGVNGLMQRYFQAANAASAKSIRNIASGYRINTAADDAAGLAIGQKMYAQITGLQAASQNTQDAISMTRVADGALGNVHDILNRMDSLALRASNGTFGDDERSAMQAEYDQLAGELNRIGKSSNFNGNPLFDGSTYTMQIGDAADDTMDISLNELSMKNLGLDKTSLMSAESAMQASTALRNATNAISTQRSRLGAAENRLQSTYNTLGINDINMQQSVSRIMDADIGKEILNRNISDVLSQASIAMMKNSSYLMQYSALQLLR